MQKSLSKVQCGVFLNVFAMVKIPSMTKPAPSQNRIVADSCNISHTKNIANNGSDNSITCTLDAGKYVKALVVQ